MRSHWMVSWVWQEVVHSSSRVPETCRINAKKHWSCFGRKWWPNTLLRHFYANFSFSLSPVYSIYSCAFKDGGRMTMIKSIVNWNTNSKSFIKIQLELFWVFLLYSASATILENVLWKKKFNFPFEKGIFATDSSHQWYGPPTPFLLKAFKYISSLFPP